MTGYKKCMYLDKKDDDYQVLECIVQLEIPADAKVVRPWIGYGTRTNKLRCDKAIVKAIFSYNEFGNYYRLPDSMVAYSITSLSDLVDDFRNDHLMEIFKIAFKYVVGETVTPKYDLDDNENNECGSGIHFFKKIKEATNYFGLWPAIFNITDTFEYFNE